MGQVGALSRSMAGERTWEKVVASVICAGASRAAAVGACVCGTLGPGQISDKYQAACLVEARAAGSYGKRQERAKGK